MAFKPSLRKKSDDLEMELDIRPVMNLMVVLIPLLLAGAEWVKLGVIEINIPPAKTGVGGGDTQQEVKEIENRLGLSIAITRDGITIANASTLLAGESGEGPTVGKTADGKYDYEKLREKLIEIKKLITGKGYVDENRVVLTAGKDIEYQIIIDIMDNVQTYDSDDEKPMPLALFPEVNFGKIMY
jgi:biopolymer transport protein ExbD